MPDPAPVAAAGGTVALLVAALDAPVGLPGLAGALPDAAGACCYGPRCCDYRGSTCRVVDAPGVLGIFFGIGYCGVGTADVCLDGRILHVFCHRGPGC
jgi:hypothetical protein